MSAGRPRSAARSATRSSSRAEQRRAERGSRAPDRRRPPRTPGPPPVGLSRVAQPTTVPSGSIASQESRAGSKYGRGQRRPRRPRRRSRGRRRRRCRLACTTARIAGTSSRVGRRVVQPAGSVTADPGSRAAGGAAHFLPGATAQPAAGDPVSSSTSSTPSAGPSAANAGAGQPVGHRLGPAAAAAPAARPAGTAAPAARHRPGLPLRPGQHRLQRGHPGGPHRQQVRRRRSARAAAAARPRARAPGGGSGTGMARQAAKSGMPAGVRRGHHPLDAARPGGSSRAGRRAAAAPHRQHSARFAAATSSGADDPGGGVPAVGDRVRGDEAERRRHRLGADVAERAGPRR